MDVSVYHGRVGVVRVECVYLSGSSVRYQGRVCVVNIECVCLSGSKIVRCHGRTCLFITVECALSGSSVRC